MFFQVARIVSLAVLLATCVESKEKTQVKLKELSPYLQPPPLVKTSSASATTKLGAVKSRASLSGKVRLQSAPEDSPSIQRVPRWNPAKESVIDTIVPSKERNNHGLPQFAAARTKLFPLSSGQRQQTASSTKRQRAILPHSLNQQILTQNPHHHSKDCNPCNKVPWIPILEEHSSSALDTSIPDSVGHYSHHRDLPVSSLPVASKPLGAGISDDFALKLSEQPDFRSDLHKTKDSVTYLPPTPHNLNTWTPSSSYVTPHSLTLSENINPRFVHSDKLSYRLPKQNVRLRKHPGPMYRYLLPPPLVPQFPVENKIAPSLSSSLTASKTETLYGLPIFIPPKPNISSHQNVKFIQPTQSPPYIQQAITFTAPHESPHFIDSRFKIDQINYQNSSAHDLSGQFYEPQNYFSVPPLYETHQFSQTDYNVSLPENLVPPGISVGNAAFPPDQQGNNNQISQSSHISDSELKLLDVRGSNFDVVPSIPISEESYNFSESTNNNDVVHTTVTEPNISYSQPSEDQVISPSQNNQHPNTNFYNSHQQYVNPAETHYYFNAPQHTHSGPNLEVIKSVQVANYISSIEYPLQIIHSPYIDINTSSPIESVQNKTLQQPTTDLRQHHYAKNTSLVNLNSDTSDIIFGKPITGENNYYSDFNATNGDNISNISNLGQPNFGNIEDFKVYNDSYFDSSDYFSRQNISSYNDNNAQYVLRGNGDYSTIFNNASTDSFQFEPQINNSQDSNVRLVNGDSYDWYNSQYEANTEKNKDTVGEDSHSITNKQIAYFSPSSTPTPQKVTVYIQPSLQTTALRGASLVHQINNLKHPYQPIPPFANDQFLSSHQNNPSHNLVRFPQVVPIPQPQVPTPFRNIFRDIENMQPPPFNYIGVINRPLFNPTPPTASAHNAFINKPPQNFLNNAQNEGQVFKPNSRPSQGDNFKWTTIPGSTSAPVPTKPPVIPSWHTHTTSMPLQDSVHGQSIHSVDSAVLLPPPIQHNKRPNIPAKNGRPIQIIVPYTSGKDTFSFQQNRGRPLDVETTGWSPMTGSLNGSTNKTKNCSNSNIKQISECNTSNNLNQWWQQQQEDYHQHQESRTVTATASATSSPFRSSTVKFNSLIQDAKPIREQKPITITQQHILASNIQDLLRGERENNTFSDSIDVNQLQKYIDEWTVSEYSSFNTSGNTSKYRDIQTSVTPEAQSSVLSHHLIPSKKIPAEYLTTPPSIFDDFMSVENSIATAVPRISIKTIPNILVTKIPAHDINSSLGSSSLKGHFSTKSKELNSSDQTSNFFKNSFVWNTLITGQEIGHTATTSPTTTDLTTEATTYDITTETEMTSSPSWEDLQVSISPITKEKVYVVTPLSTWPPEPSSTPWPSSNSHKGILSNTPKTTKTGAWDGFPFRNSANTVDTFHSPRFSIRPTPGTTMQRSFTVTNDDNEFEESKVTTFYPAENEISYTYNSKEAGVGNNPRGTSSTRRSTADTDLWGLTDLPTYTPPVGTRIHTYSGHSRVVTTPTVSTAAVGQRSSPRQPVGILKKYQPDHNSYLWHFPELLAPSGEDETAAVRSAIVELQKKKQR